jgi:mannose-6-phosphate isomerase-like protein (cupin superfamily)
MILVDPNVVELSDSWQADDSTARWRSGPGHSPTSGAQSSGSSLLEVDPGCRLPRHTDSAEEVIAVISGRALIAIGAEECAAGPGALIVVPKRVPHEVRNAGAAVLRFAAIYAEPDVVTTYERDVEPEGSPQRHTVS